MGPWQYDPYVEYETAFTNSLALKLSRDFGFYGFAAEQNSFT